MKLPTQADVARLAGVSRATVSYVINDQAGGRVPISEETRQRVQAAVAELGYVPDTRAQALRSGNTHTIGLIIPDIRNPHFWEVAAGVEQAAQAAGYHMLLSSISPESKGAEESFKTLANRRIDGLIMVPSFLYQSEKAQKILAALLKRGLPIVGMMAEHSYANLQIDRVLSDYRDATVTIMEHLIALHHRRIGFVYGIAVPTLGEDRLVAYQASLQAAGLPLDPALVIHCGPTVEDSYQATLTLLQRPHRPTALLAINDFFAAGAVRAISDLGLKVPQDISLFGYDDISLAKYFVPRLSTASKDGEKTGQEAVRLLLARLQQPDLPRQEVRLPARVILRESIGPAPR